MSWVRCCLDRPLLKRRVQKTSGPLDERFGDPSISGPMEGGWNQVSTSPEMRQNGFASRVTSSEQPSATSESEYSRTRSKAWRYSPLNFKTRKSSIPSESEKIMGEKTNSSSQTKEKADFVYKPASGDFLKTMADLGKPKNGRPSTEIANPTTNNRHTSLQSNSSLEPTLPGEIPRHPFHQDISTRSHSPAHRTYSNKSSSPTEQNFHDSRTPMTAYSTSARNSSARDEECSSYTTTIEAERSPRSVVSDIAAPIPTSGYLPSNPAPSEASRKKRGKAKPKRVVTSEMVPSTNDLFG